MAGDWIKMRSDLRTHPKVVLISSRCHRDIFGTIGGLHSIWSVFDAHSTDGTLEGYTPETMDVIAGFPGLVEAMASVGWIIVEPEKLICPRFDSHNSKSAKNRATEQEKKRNQRTSRSCPDSVPMQPGQMSPSERDKNGTREEKRREDISLPIGSDSGARKPERKPRKVFVPPSLDDVKQYAASRDSPVNPSKFFDHYEANGWKRGKTKMADWQATFRTWETTENDRATSSTERPSTATRGGQPTLDSSLDAIARFAARHAPRSGNSTGSPVRLEANVELHRPAS